jgi:putative transposase
LGTGHWSPRSARRWGAVAFRVGGMSDHIQLLTRYCPSLAVSKLAGEIKGVGSYAMTHSLAPRRPFRWQDGYGAFSLRKSDGPIVERYILNQKQHHSPNQHGPKLQPSNLHVPSRLQTASHA